DTSAKVVFDDVGFGPAGSFYTPPASSNLLANPEFEFDRGEWSLVAPGSASSYTTWSRDDGYGGVGGSLVLVANAVGDQAGVYQCVNIAAQRVDLQLYSKVNYTGGGPNTGAASVSSFDVPDCAGGYIVNRVAPVVSADAAGWRRFLLRDYALPAATRSAMVFFTVALQDDDATSVSLTADHFSFGPAEAVPGRLFVDGFE
ncbi:MAG TPA: hypothetical protein VJ724_06240, partial [Tahibacter sp.]|nr:hypothetical protein [Tahibacter sp.]